MDQKLILQRVGAAVTIRCAVSRDKGVAIAGAVLSSLEECGLMTVERDELMQIGAGMELMRVALKEAREVIARAENEANLMPGLAEQAKDVGALIDGILNRNGVIRPALDS